MEAIHFFIKSFYKKGLIVWGVLGSTSNVRICSFSVINQMFHSVFHNNTAILVYSHGREKKSFNSGV